MTTRAHRGITLLAVVATAWIASPGAVGGEGHSQPIDRPFASMEDRVEQLRAAFEKGTGCALAASALDVAPATLWGGRRMLPSRDLLDETVEADRKTAEAEVRFADTLQRFAGGEACPEERGRALALKLFIEEMNEVAVAVGRITQGCGDGDACPGLATMLDETTGHEVWREVDRELRAPFSIKLRSPFVPWRTVPGWEEDVFVTEPIAGGECVAIFKETRGLMLRLRLERVDVVQDPWATPLMARGTKVPVWSLEWVPSQYGKTWRICNRGEAGLETTVSQRVKQDIPLNYFWRFYANRD